MGKARPEMPMVEELDINRNCSDIELDADDLDGDLNLSGSDDEGQMRRGMFKA